ncbi:hypothetical protein MMC25_001644 [Agyrium rufum]|nr:hypothetical protein [Agyrium rufum]
MDLLDSQDMTLPLSALSILLAVLVSSLSSQLRSRKAPVTKKHGKQVYPSGPYAIPLLGNLFTLSALQKRPDLELLKIAKNYGGLCMLWVGWRPVLIVSSPKVARDLLDRRGSLYSSRPNLNDFRTKAWPNRLVTTPMGDSFRYLRKLDSNILGPQQSAELRKYQDFESKILLSELLDKPDMFLRHAERFSMSVIFSTTYGVRLAQLDHPVMAQFYSMWEVMLRYFQPGSLLLDFFPFLQRLPTILQPWLRMAKRLRDLEMKLHGAFLATLKERISRGAAPACLGTLVLQEMEGFDDSEACDILSMAIGAGADTTSSYLQSFFKVMAFHPEVVRKAQEELDRVVGPSRLPTWSDEQSLSYIRAIIKEVHRWAPIASLGIPHATSGPDTYEGQKIPAGTIVFPNLTALSRDSDRYQDPDDFDPDRYLGDDLDAVASALHPDYRKRDHCHYGFGRRLCQGIHVAEASIFIVISRVLWAFDIKPKVGEEPLDMNAKIAGLVTKPKPYAVSITSRGLEYEGVARSSRAEARTDILDFDDVNFGSDD